MGIYFFWGQEEFNINKEISSVKEKYLDKNFESLNLRYFDSPSYTDLSNALRTTGSMFGSVVNIVNCRKYFLGAKNENPLSDSDIDLLKEDLQTVADNVQTVFFLNLPRNEKKSIAQKKLYKLLSKTCETKEFKQFKGYESELFNWIVKQAKANDMTISTATAKFLVEHSGVNLVLLNSQLEKLKVCIYPNKNITQEDILKHLDITENLYKIAGYIVNKRKDLAILEYKKLSEKAHYLEILAFLQTTFTNLVTIKSDIENLSLQEVAQKQGLPPFIIKQNLEMMANVSLAQLVQIKKNLIKAEETIKVDFSQSGDLELEKALLSDF